MFDVTFWRCVLSYGQILYIKTVHSCSTLKYYIRWCLLHSSTMMIWSSLHIYNICRYLYSNKYCFMKFNKISNFECVHNFKLDINECAKKPCKNGGKCKDGVNKYTCTCVAGYTGTTCQTSNVIYDKIFFLETVHLTLRYQ